MAAWCEPFPVSRGEGVHGACTGLVGGPASYRSPTLQSMPAGSAGDELSSLMLAKVASPERLADDALMSLQNPCSYMPRGDNRAARWDEEDDDLPAATAKPAPRTRFIESRGYEVLEDEELPPRVRVPASTRAAPQSPAPASADGAAAGGEKSVPGEQRAASKSVRWSEHLCNVAYFECVSRETSPVPAEDADILFDRPRLPRRNMTNFAPSGAFTRRQMMAEYAPAQRSCATAERAARAPGASAAARPARSATEDDNSDKPRLPRGAADMLRGSIVPSRARFSKAGTNFMELLGEVGLLQLVWPAERVIMGLCVCSSLKSELVSCSPVVIPVRQGGDIPKDHVLQKLSGALVVCAAVAAVHTPKPSESTRSIKFFMKRLWEDDEVQDAAGDGAQTAPHQGRASASVPPAQRTGQGLLPLARLRSVRHRIHKLQLENCRLGLDNGMGVSNLLYVHKYRGSRCSRQNDMEALTELSLARNLIGTAPGLMSALASLPNLRVLNLAHNSLGPAGSKALSEALPKFLSLTALDLADNKIEDEGMAALCGALPQVLPLCKLSVPTNSITDEGAAALALALPACAALVDVDLSVPSLPCAPLLRNPPLLLPALGLGARKLLVRCDGTARPRGSAAHAQRAQTFSVLGHLFSRRSERTSSDACSSAWQGNLVTEEGQWTLAAARVTCRLGRSSTGDGGGGAWSRLVNIDTRRFRHFHPLRCAFGMPFDFSRGLSSPLSLSLFPCRESLHRQRWRDFPSGKNRCSIHLHN